MFSFDLTFILPGPPFYKKDCHRNMLSEDHLYSLLMRSTPARMEQAARKEQGIFFNDKKAKKELFNLLHFCFKLYWFVIVFFPEYN